MGRYSYTEEDVNLVRSLYNQGEKIDDIINKTGISLNTLYRLMRRNNIERNRWEHVIDYTKESISLFNEKYINSKYIPFVPNGNYKYCKSNYILNYFDCIDNQDKAYILGLWYADGNIKDNYVASITLQEKDVEILEKIKKIIGKKGDLLFVPSRNPNWQNCYKLSINSKRMIDALKYHGLSPKKSLNLTFPTNFPFEFYKDFIRGYIDGDGSILNYGRQSHVSLTSTKQFCGELKFFIENYLKIHCSIRRADVSKNNNTTCVLQIGGRKQIKKFLDWIYLDANLFLQRKYDEYLEIVKSMAA